MSPLARPSSPKADATTAAISRWMIPGTRAERLISKPWSPITQPISPVESGSSRDHCRVTRQSAPPASGWSSPTPTRAAAPSAKMLLATTASLRLPYWKCRLHSSTHTTSTTAEAWAVAKASATRRALKAPWQPMKPTWVRLTSAASPRPRTMSRSTPGFAKPVHEQVTRCVTAVASTPHPASALRAAARASGPASAA